MQTLIGATYERDGELFCIMAAGRDENCKYQATLSCIHQNSEDLGMMVAARSVTIKDPDRITEAEFFMLSDGKPDTFEPTKATIKAVLEIAVHDNPGIRLTEVKEERDRTIARLRKTDMHCPCNNRKICPCSSIVRVASGEAEECNCGLFVAE